jgi:hypothetical protein
LFFFNNFCCGANYDASNTIDECVRSICSFFIIFVVVPIMMPPTQLMNKFSPTPNDLTLEELHLVVGGGEFLTNLLSVL